MFIWSLSATHAFARVTFKAHILYLFQVMKHEGDEEDCVVQFLCGAKLEVTHSHKKKRVEKMAYRVGFICSSHV